MKQATAGILAALVALSPVPAVALECEYNSSFQSDYWWHKEAAETYILVRGAFTDIKLIGEFETADTRDGIQVGRKVFSAKFDGFRASRRAFDQPFSTAVTLVFPDFSFVGGTGDDSWQVKDLPGTTGLVWMLQTDKGYEVEDGPCSDIMDTDPASVKPALRCLRGGYCPKG